MMKNIACRTSGTTITNNHSLKSSVFDFGILIDTFVIPYSTLKTERTINNTNSQIPAIETLYYGFNWLYNKQTSICYCKYTLML